MGEFGFVLGPLHTDRSAGPETRLTLIRSQTVAEALLPVSYPWVLARHGTDAFLIELSQGRVLALPPVLALLADCALSSRTAEDCLTRFAARAGRGDQSETELIAGLAQLSAATGIALRLVTPTPRTSQTQTERVT